MKTLTGLPARGLTFLLTGAIRLYQNTLAYWLGGRCRFAPTCSDYALGVLREQGAFRGTLLACWRLLRCSPLSRGGWDPVPPKRTVPPLTIIRRHRGEGSGSA